MKKINFGRVFFRLDGKFKPCVLFIGTRYIDWQWLEKQHRQKVFLTEWKSAVLKTTDSVPLNMSLTVERLCFTFQYLYWEISNSNTAEGCLSKDIWRVQCTLFSINSCLALSYSLIYLFICLWLKAKFHFLCPVSYILLIPPPWILFFWFDFRFFCEYCLWQTLYICIQSQRVWRNQTVSPLNISCLTRWCPQRQNKFCKFLLQCDCGYQGYISPT